MPLSRTELMEMKEKCINELQNNDIDKDRRKALEDELSSITLELEQREFSARIKK